MQRAGWCQCLFPIRPELNGVQWEPRAFPAEQCTGPSSPGGATDAPAFRSKPVVRLASVPGNSCASARPMPPASSDPSLTTPLDASPQRLQEASCLWVLLTSAPRAGRASQQRDPPLPVSSLRPKVRGLRFSQGLLAARLAPPSIGTPLRHERMTLSCGYRIQAAARAPGPGFQLSPGHVVSSRDHRGQTLTCSGLGPPPGSLTDPPSEQ